VVTSVPNDTPEGTQLWLNFTFVVGGVAVEVPSNYTLITNNVRKDPFFLFCCKNFGVQLEFRYRPGAPNHQYTGNQRIR
jgi:hypothetical protein